MGLLIIIAALAWLLQGMLGLLQIRNFNKKYTELRRLGRVAIGKKTGKIRAGTVVMFAIDKDARILQAAQMQGVTVFSRVRHLKGFEGRHLLGLTEQEMLHCNQLTRAAIMDALNNCDIILKGGELKVRQSWLERLMPAKK
ncbi:transcriptional regulator GutM [Paenibacillus sp. FSL E2-0178]|uniref:transcriptional regulator GutM n=1 Tax=Paenibacillus sp. FSL E2-0178 TaxID=2921361 RepID=UPI0031580873